MAVKVSTKMMKFKLPQEQLVNAISDLESKVRLSFRHIPWIIRLCGG